MRPDYPLEGKPKRSWCKILNHLELKKNNNQKNEDQIWYRN
jgi:hypothetical protein